jgi:hypothetical protein
MPSVRNGSIGLERFDGQLRGFVSARARSNRFEFRQPDYPRFFCAYALEHMFW